jgi:hypothetical protein
MKGRSLPVVDNGDLQSTQRLVQFRTITMLNGSVTCTPAGFGTRRAVRFR